MLCFFQSKCSFFFFRRSRSKNCFFGNYEMKPVPKQRYSNSYKRYQDYPDYNGFRQSYHARSEYEVSTPKPNGFNFKHSTLIHLITKDKKKNVTEAMIDGLKLGPTNPYRTSYYGHCAGAGIHFVTSKNWTLPFSLVYKNNKPCFFKILRLVEGTLKLSIPNFAVRFSPFISYRLLFKKDLFQAEKNDHLKINSGPKLSAYSLVEFDGGLKVIDYDWTLNLVTIHWQPYPSKVARSWDIEGTFELIQEPVE